MTLPQAKKSLGQHFLHDKNVIEKITNDFNGQAQAILEVGPGPGVLTESLAKHEVPFHVVEKDKRFPEYLSKFISESQITLQDGLTVDFNELISQINFPSDNVWMVSNLPYNVGTLFFIRFLQVPAIKYMSLMFQREVADKIIAIDTRKGKEMGSLMALSQNYFEVKVLCKVPPGAFSPPPKVESAVVSLIRREEPVIPLSEFRRYEVFLRKLFQFKRKQIKKVMRPHYQEEKLLNGFEKAGISLTARAETFNLEQVQLLFKELEGF